MQVGGVPGKERDLAGLDPVLRPRKLAFLLGGRPDADSLNLCAVAFVAIAYEDRERDNDGKGSQPRWDSAHIQRHDRDRSSARVASTGCARCDERARLA
jgi:hypothetical protein